MGQSPSYAILDPLILLCDSASLRAARKLMPDRDLRLTHAVRQKSHRVSRNSFDNQYLRVYDIHATE
jgi:hypothetical protein